jgi:hypothetical protein
MGQPYVENFVLLLHNKTLFFIGQYNPCSIRDNRRKSGKIVCGDTDITEKANLYIITYLKMKRKYGHITYHFISMNIG